MKQSLKEIGEILIAIDGGAEWEGLIGGKWYQAKPEDSPVDAISRSGQIRLKPRTIRIGEYDVPEPMQNEPQTGDTIFCASPNDEGYMERIYYNRAYSSHKRAFARRLIHATPEAAALHGKALASLTSKEPIG